MDISNIHYLIEEDLKNFLEIEKISIDELSSDLKISKASIYDIFKSKDISNEILDKIYSYIYSYSYRLNLIKEEFLKEKNELILFHGSKKGINTITSNGSRKNCDFGNGFYLGTNYENALNFVCDSENSCVYSFKFTKDNLKIVNFDVTLEWMLAICYYREQLREYESTKIIKDIINKINNADLIIAPIADNRMFYIMSLFANGDISVDTALHSLSASNMGLQYIMKTDKGINNLIPIEKHYISSIEKNECHQKLDKRTTYIENKLKMAKRQYSNGLYIEDILK